MTKWKAGLLVLCGLQMLGPAPNAAALARTPEACLESFAEAEATFAQKVTLLSGKKGSSYIVMGGSAPGWLVCSLKTRSVIGVAACSTIFGLIAYTGYQWMSEMDRLILRAGELAMIMKIYGAVKDNRFEGSEEYNGLVERMEIKDEHQEFLRQNILRAMEKGELCDDHNVPNVNFDQFMSLVRPGDV